VPHGRRAAIILAALVLTLAMTGCHRKTAAEQQVVTIDLWHVWGGEQAAAIDKVVRAFEASHPGIRVNPVFTRNNLSTSQKFFTAVAAETPPDVVFVDGPQVAPWAEWGALEPLDERLARAGVRAEDYFEPCWRQCEYKGKVWALTYCADPNFGFVWNKDRFRQAGLDPDKPPRTIEELDEAAEKLTTRNAAGDLESIGFIPWAQYGPANSVFTWGWAFGGSFYDDATFTVTADDPKVVNALAWMISYCDRFDARKISALEAGFGSAEQDPFYTGKMSMRCLHIGGIVDIGKYAPNLDWGVSFIPSPATGGEEHSSWVGGWCMSIPVGCKHPEEAFELIRWMCHDPEGTTVVAEAAGLFPGVKDSPYFEKIKDKPYYGAFLDVIRACKHQRPVMPSQAFFMRELDRAVDAARFGKIPPPASIAICGDTASDDATRLGRELTDLGHPPAESASTALTVVVGGEDPGIAKGAGTAVLAITPDGAIPEWADGALPAGAGARAVLRWWTAKQALRKAREATQAELDLILKGGGSK
jgi:multiple sugar transport system substrate-binding protein